MASPQKIITRFAPSPTGLFHIGSARTALFSYLYARRHGGEMILRIEDTDRARSKPEFEKDILENLSWLGIRHEKMYRQSERGGIYQKHIQKLLDSGAAFVSDEKNDDGAPSRVIRFKNPRRVVTFTDAIRGEISVDTTELGDFVIAKALQEPIFHAAVVIDDAEMLITHVIRGEDHIYNTPRQILIQEALGFPRPVYAHIPLILDTDRSKLSKRKGTAVSVSQYREEGYLPEAIVNFLALLGWSPGEGDTREFFTMDELAGLFSLEHTQKSGAIFNTEKLDWMNREYMKKLPREELKALLASFLPAHLAAHASLPIFNRVLSTLLERIHKAGDMKTLAEAGDLQYFFEPPEYETQKLAWKDESLASTLQNIDKIINILQKTESDAFVSAESVKALMWDFATRAGRGSVLWPMRVALSGKERSPDPFILATILGKDETIKRLRYARDTLAAKEP